MILRARPLAAHARCVSKGDSSVVGDAQRLDLSAVKSQTEPWSLRTRVLLAMPGVAVAAVLVVLGIYILVS